MIEDSQLEVGPEDSKAAGTPSVEADPTAFLRLVGENVRRIRSDRGLTRKALSLQSGVSERFLAQLETGTGNASILVLRQIAETLHIPTASLLSGPQVTQDTEDPRRSRIALIGLRGAGKSTVGKLLAEQLESPFLELDKLVEEASGVPMNLLFDLYGQTGFRRFERRCLEEVLAEHSAFVLATSGGIVSEHDTYDRLLSSCFTVWLRATPEAHMSRVVQQGDMRPMAQRPEAMADLKRILSDREYLYAKADLTVDTSTLSTAEIAQQLTSAIQK